MIINKNKLRIAVLGFFLLAFLDSAFAAEGAATRRFGLFIGSNNGGINRATLRYAVSDAKSISRVFAGMGGISVEDNVLLVEPTVGEINRQLDNLGRISAQARRNAQRTELVFYYSGHSDENGILLNREYYGYRDLRERINAIQTDMRIVILDSCSSGAITRAKGGVKTQPFLFDSSVSAEGYAYLTSSSGDEVSQESDSIGSSYFTHSLLAGLRGAADSVGDGRVTLNELYRFAYVETLAKTETSTFGIQHPSYDIQIAGSGDVVLTDIKDISASLLISEDLTGRISIRDSSDFLVAELTKSSRGPLALGLEPGLYRITLQRGDNFYRAEINLPENRQTSLGMANFSMIAASSGSRRRGPDSSEEDDESIYPVNIQIVPGRNLLWNSGEYDTNNILFGLFVGKAYNLKGLGISWLGIINDGYVQGLQSSGIFNIAEGNLLGAQTSGIFNHAGANVQGLQFSGIYNRAEGNVVGIQAAGIFNITDGDVTGAQASGLFNIAKGNVLGIQAAGLFNKTNDLQGVQAGLVNINKSGHGAMFGLVNISESENMVPVGLVNIIKNGLLHPAVYIDDMLFSNVSFRSGSKHFYSFISAGVGGEIFFGNGDLLFISKAGFGFEYAINKFFIDIDASAGQIYNMDTIGKGTNETSDDDGKKSSRYSGSMTQIYQLRLTGGYKIFPHLGVFAGISYDYLYRNWDTSPNPKDFGGPVLGGVVDRHIHKIGFFGGVQF